MCGSIDESGQRGWWWREYWGSIDREGKWIRIISRTPTNEPQQQQTNEPIRRRPQGGIAEPRRHIPQTNSFSFKPTHVCARESVHARTICIVWGARRTICCRLHRYTTTLQQKLDLHVRHPSSALFIVVSFMYVLFLFFFFQSWLIFCCWQISLVTFRFRPPTARSMHPHQCHRQSPLEAARREA